jgi:hypothetical protein
MTDYFFRNRQPLIDQQRWKTLPQRRLPPQLQQQQLLLLRLPLR